MITVAEKPLLWHIMMCFSQFGLNDFIICLGYKGDVIKEYFYNLRLYSSDFQLNMPSQKINYLQSESFPPWNVSLIDTGLHSNTGERLKRVKSYLDDRNFFFTYGDGLTGQNLLDTLEFHESNDSLATMTAVRPPARYGAISAKDDLVTDFAEKSSSSNSYVNGGFFVLNPRVFHLLDGEENPNWEMDILPKLVLQKQLKIFKHDGFWFSMDTSRDRENLEIMAKNGSPPWFQESPLKKNF